MNKLITASINVMKIKKELLIEGKKGKYLNVVIWINDETDQYGDDVSIEQKVAKGADKIFLGNGRSYKKTEQPISEHKPEPGSEMPF
jgi:hypothetical protein